VRFESIPIFARPQMAVSAKVTAFTPRSAGTQSGTQARRNVYLRVETHPGSVVGCNFCSLFSSEQKKGTVQNDERNRVGTKRIGLQRSPTGRTHFVNSNEGKQ
jgi:hypothetical protein